jgi:amino acid transporter
MSGIAEMVTFLPISSPFIRFAGRFVDDAFGVAAGWNFFVFEAALVPFEIVACNVIIGFWSTAVPTGVIIAIVIVLYGYVDAVVGVDDKILTRCQIDQYV